MLQLYYYKHLKEDIFMQIYCDVEIGNTYDTMSLDELKEAQKKLRENLASIELQIKLRQMAERKRYS